MSDWNWRKSSRSGSVNCVEVALSPSSVAVRDSKDRAGGFLVVDAVDWSSFVSRVKSGGFDR